MIQKLFLEIIKKMSELLPNLKATAKVRRKVRKLMTLSCAKNTQSRYFKKFMKQLEKQYSSLKSSLTATASKVTECITATASGDCDWLSCLTAAGGNCSKRESEYISSFSQSGSN